MRVERKLFASIATVVVMTIGGGAVMLPASAEAKTVRTAVAHVRHEEPGLHHEPVVEARCGGVAAAGAAVAKPCQFWTVGAGWSLYLYLNRGDVNWLYGLGYTAATAALCVWLTPTIIGGVICGVAAYVIWTVIQRWAWQVPSGYCVEAKFSYGGSFQGSKLVKRNC